MCVPLCLLIFTFNTVNADSDLTALVESKNGVYEAKCVTKTNMLNSAVFWEQGGRPVAKNSTYSFIPSLPITNFEETDEDKYKNEGWIDDDNKWSVVRSTESKFGPITDERWEDFQVYKVDRSEQILWEGSKLGSISFSLYLTEQIGYNLDIANKFYVRISHNDVAAAEIGDYPRTMTIESEIWTHFTLLLSKTNMSIIHFINETNTNELKWPVAALLRNTYNISINEVHGSENGFIKIHKYNHLRSKETNSNSQPFGSVTYKTRSNLCVSMFVALCKACSMHLTIDVKGDKFIHKRVTAPSNQKNSYIPWRRVVIEDANVTVKDRAKFYVQKINQKPNGFWAVDDVRACDPSEIKVSEVRELSQPDIKCHSLAEQNVRTWTPGTNDASPACPSGQLGAACDINCTPFFKSSYCGNIICTKAECYCSWGHRGRTCTEECELGWWGANCRNKCGKCQVDTCDKFSGACAGGCQEGYSGKTCSRYLPVLSNKPIVRNVLYTEISVKVDTTYKGRQLPRSVEIQYKLLQEKNWTNWIRMDYSNSQQELLITGLRPGTDYEIRAVLIINDTLYEDEVPSVQVKTTCRDITSDNIFIKPAQKNATISLVNLTPEMCGDSGFYTVKLDTWAGPRKMENTIGDLIPFTKYMLELKNSVTGSTTRTFFETHPDKPGSVYNIRYSSAQRLLSWSADVKGVKINYKIEYKLLGHRACKGTETDEVKHSISTSNNTVITTFTSYSYYIIKITTSNEAGVGPERIASITTDESGDIDENELPKNVYVNDNNTIVIERADCSKVKGLLEYHLKFTYDDSLPCVSSPDEVNTAIRYGDVASIQPPSTLLPFSNYLVTVTAKRNPNKQVHYQHAIKYKSNPSIPPQVRNLTAYSRNGSHVWLRWADPCPSRGIPERYSLRVSRFEETYSRASNPCTLWKEYTCITVGDLKPNKDYTFEIRAKNFDVDGYGAASKVTTRTREEPSDPPVNLTYSYDQEDQLTVRWMHPYVTNGPVRQFIISGTVQKSGIAEAAQNYTNNLTIEVDQPYYYKKVNVSPATTYDFNVRAVNSKLGKPVSVVITTPPPTPEMSGVPHVTSCSGGICDLNIPLLTSCFNCTVYVVVTSDSEPENEQAWHFQTVAPTVQKKIYEDFEDKGILRKNHWIAKEAQITPELETSFQIGNLTEGQSPLLANNNYIVSVVIVSEYEAEYSIKTYYLNFGTTTTGSHLYLLLLLLVVPLGVLMFLAFRFWKNKRELTQIVDRGSNDALLNEPNSKGTIREMLGQLSGDSIPLKVVPKQKHSRIVDVNNLKSYLEESLQGTSIDNDLTRQHEIFQSGHTKPIDTGSMTINKTKNRYKNLVAYDHSRVKLGCRDANGSDYINANYIDGYKVKRAYIATQGPKASTLNDFWLMIWEQNVRDIVMLANVIEGGKKKCEQYWPAIGDTKIFEDIMVTTVETNVLVSYTYSKLRVIRNESERTVNHLHFTDWPDHGVPLYPQCLVPLIKKMLTIPQGKHPVVVHCSAGVGRTGTVLLCDTALRMAASEQKVDFLNILYNMREQRVNLVDNPPQYVLAHLVVFECLFGRDFSIPISRNFETEIEKSLEKRNITQIMDYLNDISWQQNIMRGYVDVPLTDENKVKNRFPDASPGCAQVFLKQYENIEGSEYINAVSVDCFQKPQRYIVTQQPLPNTVGDFWRLIYEYNVNTVISLNDIKEEDKTSCVFWPQENQSFYAVRHIKLTYVDREQKSDYDLLFIVLFNEEENEKRTINVMSMKGWAPNEPIPPNLDGILALKDHMFNIAWRDDSPIVVACYDGIKASGLFAALSFQIEKMKLEHSCDIVLAVRTIRQSQPLCLQDEEQFRFLLKSVIRFFQSFDIYSNFT